MVCRWGCYRFRLNNLSVFGILAGMRESTQRAHRSVVLVLFLLKSGVSIERHVGCLVIVIGQEKLSRRNPQKENESKRSDGWYEVTPSEEHDGHYFVL
jgi:hypothetical protein